MGKQTRKMARAQLSQGWPGNTTPGTQVMTVARTSLLVYAGRGKGLPNDLEFHVFNQVLEVGLVLVCCEGEWVAVGNVQVHRVLQ